MFSIQMFPPLLQETTTTPLSPPLVYANKCFIKLLYLYDHNNTGVKKGNSLLDFNCISYLFPSSLFTMLLDWYKMRLVANIILCNIWFRGIHRQKWTFKINFE